MDFMKSIKRAIVNQITKQFQPAKFCVQIDWSAINSSYMQEWNGKAEQCSNATPNLYFGNFKWQ